MVDLKKTIKEVLEEYLEPTLILKENIEVSESIQLIPSELLKKSALFLTVADPKLFLIGKNKANTFEATIPENISVSFMNISLKLHRTELYDNIHSAIKSSQLEFPYLSNHNIHLFLYLSICL